VLEALRKRREHEQAIELAVLAVRSLLHLRDGETWDPKRSLLAAQPQVVWVLAASRDRAGANRVLRRWQEAEEATGGSENAAALELQRLVLARPFDWTGVLDAFGKHAREAPGTGDELFGQWRDLVVRKSAARDWGFEDDDRGGPAWVASLVDAARRGHGGGPAFRAELTRWLDSCGTSPGSAERLRADLGVLTLDLDALGCLGRGHPRLRRFVKGFESHDAAVTGCRREWLRRFGASQIGPAVLACWQRLVVPLTPDAARSDYQVRADWLVILFELDPDGGARLLRDWSARHAGRRSLWAEMRKRGIEPPLGGDRSERRSARRAPATPE
jgi:hypothetical protein